jgi:RHS repeat-associated protein
VKRTIDGVTRLFTYDAWNPIMEWDGSGNWKAMNLYGSGADEILGRYDSVRGALIYKQDKQGNVSFVLNSSGATVEKYTYDAYGTPAVVSWRSDTQSWDYSHPLSSAIGNRFMYTGREWIGELGIYDYRHRYYLPSIGRFIETDPTGFDAGDMNLFRYTADDPVDLTDPMGLQISEPGERMLRDRMWDMACYFDSGNSFQGSFAELLQKLRPAGTDRGNSEGGGAGRVHRDMASYAEDSVTSTKYHNTRFGTVNHCNEFVGDMAEASGRVRPMVWVPGFPEGFWRPAVSHELADPSVKIPRWTSPKPLSEARRNDIIAQQHGKWGHTGIVTSPGNSITVNTIRGGIVEAEHWGFRGPGKNGEGPHDPPPVIRHYIAGSGGEW